MSPLESAENARQTREMSDGAQPHPISEEARPSEASFVALYGTQELCRAAVAR